MKRVFLMCVFMLSTLTATAAVPSAHGLTPNLPYDHAYWSRPHNPYLKAHFDDLLDVLNRGNRVLELDLWVSSGEIAVENEAYCFDIEGGQAVLGKPLHIWRCDGGASEKWQLTPDGLFVGMGGRCAEIPHGSTQVGVQARLGNCTPGSLHQGFDVIAP